MSVCERNIWDVLGRSVRETFLTREAVLWVSERNIWDVLGRSVRETFLTREAVL